MQATGPRLSPAPRIESAAGNEPSNFVRDRAGVLDSVKPYAAATGLVALVAWVRHLLDPALGDQHPFVLFLGAVFFASWYGWRPGLLALGLGLVTADYLFIHPRDSIGPKTLGQLVGLIVYATVGSLGILLIEGLSRSRQRSEARARQLREEIVEHQKTQDVLRAATSELEARAEELTRANECLRREADARRNAEGRAHRLAALVDSSEDAITGELLDGTITDWNAGAEALFGYGAAEAVGRPAADLVSPNGRAEFERCAERLLRGETVPPFEAVRTRKDGRTVPVSVRVSPIRENGRVLGWSTISRDLTPTRSLQEQLRQSQKMQAVGQLAGGVAHDFNNLLTIINGYADLLGADLPSETPSRGALAEIRAAGARAADLTQQLLVFSRKGVLEPRVVDLNATVLGAEKMLRRLIGEDVRLITALDPDLGYVKVDPGQVEQAIMNLAVNARDAMPNGGRLTLETASVEWGGTQHPEVLPGRYVRLRVSDTGTGMDPSTRARIFEPFFTTKEVGKGTGLGLAVVHGFVTQSGGHIAVDSEPGAGTVFNIYLPALMDPKRAGESNAAPARVPTGVETVLLVEDEAAVRRLGAHALRVPGYTVLEAGSGAEAIRISDTYTGPIHLLVSDVVMPEMGGRVLAERLKGVRPEMQVLFVSGYTDDAVVRHGVRETEVAFLQKPFTPASLARKVRTILDACTKISG